MDSELMKKFLRYTSMPFEFLIIMGGATWLGYWLDKKLNSSPWLTIGLAAFGFFAALYHVFKSLKDINKGKKLLLILAFSVFSQTAFATAQIPDFLIYNGDTLAIFSNPLEEYFKNHPRPDSIFEKLGYNSTACWRGYIAYWELKNDSLYLLKLMGYDTEIPLNLIFNDRDTKGKVFADWFSGKIVHPYGELLQYIHMGYASIYEYEKVFIFKNGILIDTLTYHNEFQLSPYQQNPKLLKEYIESHIDYSNIPDPEKEVVVIVKIVSVTPDGKIDSVAIIRGADSARNAEAIRVVKSIPQWSLYFHAHGETYKIFTGIPVIFGKQTTDSTKTQNYKN